MLQEKIDGMVRSRVNGALREIENETVSIIRKKMGYGSDLDVSSDVMKKIREINDLLKDEMEEKYKDEAENFIANSVKGEV